MSGRCDVLVIGAGPAGVMAALRAGDLGARTTLLTSGAFGGMAANDGPVPVRTLAQAARLVREARQLNRYGIEVGAPRLDYSRLLARVDEVVDEVGRNAALRRQVEAASVSIVSDAGPARFVDARTVEAGGRRYEADKTILCVGGISRRLAIPGGELAATHSDAWSLRAVPASMLVIGSGATGAQVTSVFNAFGTRVELFEAGDRILRTEEPEVSACVAAAFRASGVVIHEGFGAIEAFEAVPGGVRMIYSRDGERHAAEADLAVLAVGWTAATPGLNLEAAGVAVDGRGFVTVDDHQRTSAPHIFAAGDVVGRRMLVPEAMQAGMIAATNAVIGASESLGAATSPVGSFTDPEYAQIGLGEAQAREGRDVEVVIVDFAENTRAVIDGRTTGFCKLIVDRADQSVLGCHIVGERAVEVAQLAAVAIGAGLKVGDLARRLFSFPTYAGVLARAAAIAAHRLNRDGGLSALGPAGLL
jgi:pyruvate/2-oxoglutarate dehydrogenase complex dihydrolipoamide dehydrogenase (E3) component